jgi:hypothetical protein
MTQLQDRQSAAFWLGPKRAGLVRNPNKRFSNGLLFGLLAV